jgi:hypothetical protein
MPLGGHLRVWARARESCSQIGRKIGKMRTKLGVSSVKSNTYASMKAANPEGKSGEPVTDPV